MLIKGFGEYDKVIEIDQEVGEVQITKAAGHESLKGGESIAHSKGHKNCFKQPQ